MTKRKALSKKTRFEVFKRDSFTCQYCGAHPPQAILHVDHIDPVANGGTNNIDNLVTSCAVCNLGKGARQLSEIPQSLADKAKQVAEAEEQLAGFTKIMREKRDRLEEEAWEVAEVFEPNARDGYPRARLTSIRGFLDKLHLFQVVDAAEIARSRFPYSAPEQFQYFCGICWNRIKEA